MPTIDKHSTSRFSPETRTLQAEVLELVGMLDGLGTDGRASARRCDLACAHGGRRQEIEFIVRHRSSMDRVGLRVASLDALALLEQPRQGVPEAFRVQALAACRALVRRSSEQG